MPTDDNKPWVVSRNLIFWRGLLHRCPNCGGDQLFQGRFKLHRRCPGCGMTLERGEGFFLGSMSINYGVTLMVYLTPVLIAALLGWLAPMTAVVLALFGAVLFPILFYRTSRCWWLMAYFYFLPHELPANRGGFDAPESEEY